MVTSKIAACGGWAKILKERDKVAGAVKGRERERGLSNREEERERELVPRKKTKGWSVLCSIFR